MLPHGFRARVTIEWSIPERVDETTITHRIQDAEDIADQILGFAAHRVRNMVQAMRGVTSEVQGLAPSVWNDEYQAKALKLAAEVRDRRHANYDPSYQEKLLLADALMHAVVSAAGMPPASHESERRQEALSIVLSEIKAWEEDERVNYPDDEVLESLDRIRDALVPVQAMRGMRESVRREVIDAVNPLRIAIAQAIDLLTEKTYGNPARSPGHNARLVLERALASPATPAGEGKDHE